MSFKKINLVYLGIGKMIANQTSMERIKKTMVRVFNVL
jgi:hypothetical protein